MSDATSVARQYAAFAAIEPADLAHGLESFASLLAKWQRAQNLVSRETGDLWNRHMADSLQLLRFIERDHDILDIGSGGGFPAIPLAIALRHRDFRFTLVESNSRKASFLRTAARELDLNLKVEAFRIEQIAPRETSLITSRALAPLAQLLSMTATWFTPGTRALFHKGKEFGEELDKSRALWHFDVIIHPSDTDAAAAILEISNVRAIGT